MSVTGVCLDFVNRDIFGNSRKREPHLTREEEVALGKRVERGDKRAREKLVTANQGLVTSIVKRFLRMSGTLTINDLVQEGNTGLIRAAGMFDWRKGCRFSTFATLWIRQAIQRALREHSQIVRYSERMWRCHGAFGRIASGCYARRGQGPSERETASRLGISPNMAWAVMRRAVLGNVASLDGFKSQLAGKGATPLSILVDRETSDRASDKLAEAIAAVLEPREVEVLALRFGMVGSPMTLKKTGEFIGGLTKERARQIQDMAIIKLKLYLGLEVPERGNRNGFRLHRQKK